MTPAALRIAELARLVDRDRASHLRSYDPTAPRLYRAGEDSHGAPALHFTPDAMAGARRLYRDLCAERAAVPGPDSSKAYFWWLFTYDYHRLFGGMSETGPSTLAAHRPARDLRLVDLEEHAPAQLAALLAREAAAPAERAARLAWEAFVAASEAETRRLNGLPLAERWPPSAASARILELVRDNPSEMCLRRLDPAAPAVYVVRSNYVGDSMLYFTPAAMAAARSLFNAGPPLSWADFLKAYPIFEGMAIFSQDAFARGRNSGIGVVEAEYFSAAHVVASSSAAAGSAAAVRSPAVLGAAGAAGTSGALRDPGSLGSAAADSVAALGSAAADSAAVGAARRFPLGSPEGILEEGALSIASLALRTVGLGLLCLRVLPHGDPNSLALFRIVHGTAGFPDQLHFTPVAMAGARLAFHVVNRTRGQSPLHTWDSFLLEYPVFHGMSAPPSTSALAARADFGAALLEADLGTPAAAAKEVAYAAALATVAARDQGVSGVSSFAPDALSAAAAAAASASSSAVASSSAAALSSSVAVRGGASPTPPPSPSRHARCRCGCRRR